MLSSVLETFSVSSFLPFFLFSFLFNLGFNKKDKETRLSVRRLIFNRVSLQLDEKIGKSRNKGKRTRT